MISKNQGNNKMFDKRKNIEWFDIEKVEDTRESELMVTHRLNVELTLLQNKERKGYIVVRNEEKFAPADLDIYEYDYVNVKQGRKLPFKIEVEEKSSDFERHTLPSGEIISLPPLGWTHIRFLGRKVENEKFKDLDIYVLCNKRPNDQIFWTTFGNIRQSCERYVRILNDPKEVYYQILIPKDYKHVEDKLCGFIFYGYESLAKHIIKYSFLKNEK